MANRVLQLAQWMKTKADSQSLTLNQRKALTLNDIYSALPEEYKERLTEIIFQKAKNLLIYHTYNDLFDQLKTGSIKDDIIAIFPDASFTIQKGRHPKIIIEV